MNNPFEAIEARLKNIESLLLDLKHPQNENQKAENYQPLTIKEAAEFLSLAVPTIYSLVNKSKIPVYKRGKRLYFSKEELLKWIQSGRKKTIHEIELEAESFLSKRRAKNG